MNYDQATRSNLQIEKGRLQTEQAKIEKSILEIEHQIKIREGLTSTEKLADELHSLNCGLAHEDQCGWYYETWENYKGKAYSSRQRWAEKAQEAIDLLPSFSIEEIIAVARVVK